MKGGMGRAGCGMGRAASRASWVFVLLGLPGLGGCATARPADAPSVRSTAAPASCPSAVRGLGRIAFTASGRLELVDLATCRVRVVRGAGATDPRFSPDGRWLAYAEPVAGAPTRLRLQGQIYGMRGVVVVPSSGGRARSPLGPGIVAWSWGPTGERVYGITGNGSLVSASPVGGRRIVAAHLGTLSAGTGFGLSPDGAHAVIDRSSCGPPAVGELDVIDLHSGTVTVALRSPGRFLTFAGWSPNGRWLLFWTADQCSASLAADGLPLQAVPVTGGRPAKVVGHMLTYDDFLSWCGTRLIAAAGPSRETNLGSALVQTGPPAWREHTIRPARKLSWVSPTCAPSGHVLAAAAGPNNAPVMFGLEHRSIWLLRPDGTPVRRLASPSARDLSYEAPRFSRNGRWILFVGTRVVPGVPGGFGGSSDDAIELVPTSGAESPVPIIDFTSNDFSYYDHFDWPQEIGWSQPGPG
jgi:hypothetical protein